MSLALTARVVDGNPGWVEVGAGYACQEVEVGTVTAALDAHGNRVVPTMPEVNAVECTGEGLSHELTCGV